ncbi:efflux RND transporter periplasmic adaptor subunit, partial [Methylobacterium trifolii]
FQIVAGGDIELVAEAPLSDLGRIVVGQAVTVKPLGLPDVSGSVRRVEAGADAAAQVGRVRITLANTPDARIGTFARGLVKVGERCGVGVPYSAVQYEAEGTVVQVVDGTRIETRQVSVGLLSGDNAEIVSGLSESDLVVIRAGAFLREGDQVEPIVVKDDSGSAPGTWK